MLAVSGGWGITWEAHSPGEAPGHFCCLCEVPPPTLFQVSAHAQPSKCSLWTVNYRKTAVWLGERPPTTFRMDHPLSVVISCLETSGPVRNLTYELV